MQPYQVCYTHCPWSTTKKHISLHRRYQCNCAHITPQLRCTPRPGIELSTVSQTKVSAYNASSTAAFYSVTTTVQCDRAILTTVTYCWKFDMWIDIVIVTWAAVADMFCCNRTHLFQWSCLQDGRDMRLHLTSMLCCRIQNNARESILVNLSTFTNWS